MKRVIPSSLVVLLLFSAFIDAAVRGSKAMYVGGTVQSISQNSKGEISFGENEVLFKAEKGDQKFSMPYRGIETMEYGQKAGRRVGVALAVSPLFLFSKKKKHFITLGFVDAGGKKQGAVFELAKGIVPETIATLEAKTGKKFEYESDDAKKNAQKK